MSLERLISMETLATKQNMATIINKRFLIISSALLFVLISAPVSVLSQPNDTIDQTITKNFDVTGDGIDDDIVLNITGESWHKPITWTLTIVSGGKTIFEHKSYDKWLDENFNDKGYVDNTCTSYLECKKQYYLDNLLKHLIVTTDLSPNIHAYDRSNTGSIYTVAKKELMEKYSLSETNAMKTIEWMIKKLKTKKTPVLYVPISPVQNEFPRMFVDRVGKFVTIYEW